MPVLELEIVTPTGETLHPKLAKQLADRIGEIFASPPGSVWVRLRSLPSESYAENDRDQVETPLPVFVSILKAKPLQPEEQHREVAQLTNAIAELCRRPAENVHVLYLPPGSGRVAFGGRVVD
ncbi:MAG: hypothetical protein ACWGO1_14985 [Anaerolineales bacterium]